MEAIQPMMGVITIMKKFFQQVFKILSFFLFRSIEGLSEGASRTSIHQCSVPDASGCAQCAHAR